MSKQAEVEYVGRMAEVLNVSTEEVLGYLTRKPYPDPNRSLYFLDLGQIMKLLPPVPARILDLGVGPGWTSEFLARCGYSVVGVDIAPDMIKLASRRLTPELDLIFEVHDYEHSLPIDGFDVAVIYDALHHAVNEGQVAANVFKALKPGGMFITLEPGVGHAESQEAQDAIRRFGTTEKDMEYARQVAAMREAGFGTVKQYLRVSALPLESVNDEDGRNRQWDHVNALWEGTLHRGLTSVVVAVKDDGAAPVVAPPPPAPAPKVASRGIVPRLRRALAAFRAEEA